MTAIYSHILNTMPPYKKVTKSSHIVTDYLNNSWMYILAVYFLITRFGNCHLHNKLVSRIAMLAVPTKVYTNPCITSCSMRLPVKQLVPLFLMLPNQSDLSSSGLRKEDIGWEAKGFNYMSFAFTVRSFCLWADGVTRQRDRQYTRRCTDTSFIWMSTTDN